MPVPAGLAMIGCVLDGLPLVGKGVVARGLKHTPPGQVFALKVPGAHFGTSPICPINLGGTVGLPLGLVVAPAGAAQIRATAPAAIIPPATAAGRLDLDGARCFMVIPSC
jgi:hypothetical protein